MKSWQERPLRGRSRNYDLAVARAKESRRNLLHASGVQQDRRPFFLFANGRKEPNMTVHEDYGPYKVHALANALPLIEGEEFDQLVADVRAHGLTHPITLSSDEPTILDGRNRYRACAAALVDPSFTTVPAAWDENAVA